MQATMQCSIIHQFYASQGQLGLRLAPSVLAVDQQVADLVQELREVYDAKPAKGYARFVQAEDDTELALRSDFPEQLSRWRAEQLNFVAFSHLTAQRLLQQLQHYGVLEQGFLLIASYYERGEDFLLVAFLPNKDGVSIAADLSVDRSSQLELSRVQLAATLNLSAWQRGDSNDGYISFLKGRVGRKVNDFFLDFLGCRELYNAKQQSQQLVQSVEAFVQQQQLPAPAAMQVRHAAFSLGSEKWQQQQPMALCELSEHLQQQVSTAQSFAEFAAGQDAPVVEQFAVDRSVLRKLIKFQGQGGGLSVAFDQQQLGERVVYDVATDTLTIHGTPPNLRDQLRRFYGIDS